MSRPNFFLFAACFVLSACQKERPLIHRQTVDLGSISSLKSNEIDGFVVPEVELGEVMEISSSCSCLRPERWDEARGRLPFKLSLPSGLGSKQIEMAIKGVVAKSVVTVKVNIVEDAKWKFLEAKRLTVIAGTPKQFPFSVVLKTNVPKGSPSLKWVPYGLSSGALVVSSDNLSMSERPDSTTLVTGSVNVLAEVVGVHSGRLVLDVADLKSSIDATVHVKEARWIEPSSVYVGRVPAKEKLKIQISLGGLKNGESFQIRPTIGEPIRGVADSSGTGTASWIEISPPEAGPFSSSVNVEFECVPPISKIFRYSGIVIE